MAVGLAQRSPLTGPDPLSDFRADVAATSAKCPELEMLVYPELHLHSVDDLPAEQRSSALRQKAVDRNSAFVADIGRIAADHGIWLCPGSVGEITDDGSFFNTQLLFSPTGELVSAYRKMFPWRPHEPHRPGTEFVVAPIPDRGSFGLSICYDAWFPEHSRHLSWMGAEAILNIVKTTSQDREQELVLARANAIVNQVYVLSVNCAEPVGRGRSIAVDPEGFVLGEAGLSEDTIVVRVNPARVRRVRDFGTAGTNRMWSQFTPDDSPISLPLYNGSLDPIRWSPGQSTP